MEGLPIRFLRNEVVVVPFGGGEFRLAGVEQNHFGGEDLIKTLPGSRQDGLEVLLAHYPSTVYRIPHGRVQLVLSGHTHGGQIRWPFFGCLWTNDALPNRLAHGLHWVNGTWLHVTSGVGVTPPVKVRINCPAELSVLTLKQAYYMPPERMDHDPKRITVLSDSGV